MDEKQTPTQDDKIVGALGHAAALLPMWGIVVPAIIWVTQREKSDYIRQQSIQALAWQVTQIILLFGGFALYMVSFFLMFGSVFIMEEMAASGPPAGFFLPFCVMGFIFLIMIVTIIVAIYAAVRNLQGHDFTYPLVGQRVRAYLAK
ncbi:DUF4870 domain-containing protein [Candidatus Leptofilum sp.]|uniref:DUF4870 domain-containing protein n=1 Tax=Candidatus Leptofilum sp. TaxID=3241576 RepID=UPI003B59EBB8